MSTTAFLARPGRGGAFAALMDEYARAAQDFCDQLDGFDRSRWLEARADNEELTRTPCRMALHACRAAWGYSKSLRGQLDLPLVNKPAKLDDTATPADIRAELMRALHDTEDATEPLHELPEKQVMAMTFMMPWGQQYDPEILLEHAIVHLLRHRRQLNRW